MWINGVKVGENNQLFLLFDCIVETSSELAGTEVLVVKVSNLLKPDSITQQVCQEDYLNENRYRYEIFPAVRFDFFPFGGIHRPAYCEALFAHANKLDPNQPKTMANVLYVGNNDPVFKYCDFISINRYHGCYQEPGQLDRALEDLATELDYIGKTYSKPILVSEFGADTISGALSTSEQFSC